MDVELLEVFVERRELVTQTTRAKLVWPLTLCAPRSLLSRNPFDAVVIPRELIVQTCHDMFLLGGEQLEEAESKAIWERRLAIMTADEADEMHEAVVISKYDLLPESLADLVQVKYSLCQANS